MSIEFSPPTRLLSVLDTLVPAETSAGDKAPGAFTTGPVSLFAAAENSHQPHDGDRGSALLAQDFGSRQLPALDVDELPQVDAAATVNLQAQQWVQFILAAWL